MQGNVLLLHYALRLLMCRCYECYFQDEALAEFNEAKQALRAAMAAAAAASKSAGEKAEGRSQDGGNTLRRLSRLCKRSSKRDGLEGAYMQHPGCSPAAWQLCHYLAVCL